MSDITPQFQEIVSQKVKVKVGDFFPSLPNPPYSHCDIVMYYDLEDCLRTTLSVEVSEDSDGWFSPGRVIGIVQLPLLRGFYQRIADSI